jgi:RNA polymerase sigma-70 factor (ECF subfamily)
MDPDLNLKSYLYRACRNQALQHLRHLKIENRDHYKQDLADPGRSPEAAAEAQEIAAAVYAAVAELPPHRRLIFSLSKYDNLTYAEIAEIQQISIKTVETQMGRALKYLRQRLADQYAKETQR